MTVQEQRDALLDWCAAHVNHHVKPMTDDGVSELVCFTCDPDDDDILSLTVVRVEEADRLRALEELLRRAIESLRDAERELHVWVDRDRKRNPGWLDVGYEPWSNKPSLALWSVDVAEIDAAARALLAGEEDP